MKSLASVSGNEESSLIDMLTGQEQQFMAFFEHLKETF